MLRVARPARSLAEPRQQGRRGLQEQEWSPVLALLLVPLRPLLRPQSKGRSPDRLCCLIWMWRIPMCPRRERRVIRKQGPSVLGPLVVREVQGQERERVQE